MGSFLGVTVSSRITLMPPSLWSTVAPNGIDGGCIVADIPDAVLSRSTPDFGFEQEGDNPALLFCTVGPEQPHPVILVHDPGGWRFLDMPDESFDQSTWVYVGATRDRKLMWAVTDVDVEDPGWDLEIVFSSNAGRSWEHIGTVTKPIYVALLDSFARGDSGKGSLTIYLDDGAFYGGRRSRQLARGYYTYYTYDGGRHWPGRRYSRQKPRLLPRALVQPSYVASRESNSGIDELKALMARLEVGRSR